MAKRGKIGQAKHDRKVQKEAEILREKGYRVYADLPGRPKPPKVGGRIPDVYARKGKKLIVVEVETTSTINTDREQQRRLREGTKKLGGKFKVKVAR